jgi:hypothetical protein
MPHNQCAPVVTKEVIELNQGFADKFHAAILPWQFVQNIPVKDKGGIHALMLFERVIEGGMIVQPKIASQPDEGSFFGVLGLHLR